MKSPIFQEILTLLSQDLQNPFGERLYEYQATGLTRAEIIIGAFIGGLVSFSIQE